MIAKLKLDKRRETKSGEYPIKIYICVGRRTRLVSTGLFVREELFDSVRGEVIGRGQAKFNEKLAMIRRRIEEELEGLTLSQAVERANWICNWDGSRGSTFASFWRDKVSSMTMAESTRRTYELALAHMPDADRMLVEEVDKTYVRSVQDRMRRVLNANTTVLYMSKLRHIVRLAMDDDLITRDPFRGIVLKGEETRKRSLTLAKLKSLRDLPLSGASEYARDMFMLSFYLIGINLVDLYSAEPVEDGRLGYRRSKTHRLYDIKVEPEAAELISKYRGDGRLVDMSSRYSIVHNAQIAVNVQLKRFIPHLSWYWARHTWATLAASIDTPMDTISMALGHSFGLSVTNIYVRRDQSKVDEANRRVLDLLL